jgi:methanogenic corrinoid protein MtbC1
MIDIDLLRQSVGNVDSDKVNAMLDEFLASHSSEKEARQVLEACQQGLEIVGERFENGTYFVGDMMYAGALLSSSVERLKPLLGFGVTEQIRGVIVLGTVEGDIHYIGKNLFRVMLESSDFKVIDIGVDQPPSAFVDAVQRYDPDIVGLSGLLTTSVDSMKETVDALKKANLRKKLYVEIGGTAVNEDVCTYVGADAWSRNAYESVKICRQWMEEKRHKGTKV